MQKVAVQRAVSGFFDVFGAARTELGKLNTRCTVETYKSAGVQYYRWLTTIDGRERASHAEMNGRICSVTDGEIYFEQNPAQPLRPIEHQRTGDMYHGHPGTDFQCRCSMVMWDPEIDGDYEVKESDLIEQKAAEEQAEKEAQERAEAERQAKEQAERERERLENERLKAELEKARQKTAEREKRLENESKLFKTRFREQINRMNIANHQERKTKRKLERKEVEIERLSAENAAFAQKISEMEAQRKYPGVNWKNLDGIMIAESRFSAKSKNARKVLEDELETARILRDAGHSVWLVPEDSLPGKKPDAIIDGILVDFKHVKFSKFERRFSKGLEQAGSVCIRLVEENISIDRIVGKLRRFRKSGWKGFAFIIIGKKIFRKGPEDF